MRLRSVIKNGSELHARIGSDYGMPGQERLLDQVIVNHGTLPLEDLYFALKPLSRNAGAVDYNQLLAGHPQSSLTNLAATFQLFRIGDAVAARNTHAAIYDALRLVKDL